ncbi:T9SS type A sorting domain-containing protein [bacterium]|nr:T9SS type A sorting domain-containing protein [bacterium]
MKAKYFAVILCLFSIFHAGVWGQCNNALEVEGGIYGDTSCIPAQDGTVWTYRHRYSDNTDMSDVMNNAWSVEGELEEVESGFDFIKVKSTGTEPGLIRYSYQLKSDQNETCVKNGCVSISYFSEITVNKISDLNFKPVIDGNPYVSAGQTAIFGVDNLHGANSVVWDAPQSLKIVKYSFAKDYATYRVVSTPQPGDTLRVKMNFTCRGDITAKIALSGRTEKPEIENPEDLDCLPEEQDRVELSVKNPLPGYVYWWSCVGEDWKITSLNAQGSKALLVATGENNGVLVLSATNAYATDTASSVYKVVRCVENCEYDTLSGIDITEATCLRTGDTAIFRILADPSATSYTWEFGGGWEPLEYVTENPYDTVVKVRVGTHKGWAKVTGKNCAGEWTMQTSDSIAISFGELNLQQYDGCVNIGIEDTLLLQVENPVEGLHYAWSLPEAWQPLGCDTCGELTVVALENAATTQVYSVSTSICDKAFDTIQVRGADTTICIVISTKQYLAFLPTAMQMASTTDFILEWYKEDFSPSNYITTNKICLVSRFGGFPPLLKYKSNENNTCWSTTAEIMTLSTSMFSAENESSARQEQVEDRIECLPNPTTNQTLLRWETDIDRIEVVSESGQRVLSYNVSGLTQKIVDMSMMPAGVYFIRFLADNSVVATKKLIKR